jgi:hypothetical protein
MTGMVTKEKGNCQQDPQQEKFAAQNNTGYLNPHKPDSRKQEAKIP